MVDQDPPPLTRRALLRGALTVGAGAVVLGGLAACTADGPRPEPAPPGPTRSPDPAATGGHSIPRDLERIPQEDWSPATRRGTLVQVDYDTYESAGYERRTQRLSKRAIVYLPAGYTEDTPHDVFYLMHGGWGDETSTLGTPDDPSEFVHVLDNAIAAGRIAPLIIVCPTYNNTSPDDSASFSLALTLTENYHRELLNDLVPAVESRYSTHALDVSPEGLAASRDHRGFGGFSMGAVATWRTFQHALDAFRYFLPMSCGTSLDMADVLAAAGPRDPGDFFIGVITGTDDFAHPFDEERVALMRRTAGFVESDDEGAGNFAFRVKDGYAHDGVAATEYTYNGLRWFWGA